MIARSRRSFATNTFGISEWLQPVSISSDNIGYTLMRTIRRIKRPHRHAAGWEAIRTRRFGTPIAKPASHSVYQDPTLLTTATACLRRQRNVTIDASGNSRSSGECELCRTFKVVGHWRLMVPFRFQTVVVNSTDIAPGLVYSRQTPLPFLSVETKTFHIRAFPGSRFARCCQDGETFCKCNGRHV